MTNELILIINLIVTYGLVLLCFKFFKKEGLMAWLVIATLIGDIEVIGQIDAFCLHQTLGNVSFASTFLASNLLSEFYNRKDANKGVYLGLFAGVTFIILSRFWLFFHPNATDFAFPALTAIANGTFRVIVAGLTNFVLVQKINIWLYHLLWEKMGQSSDKNLWIRNNVSTIISQAINSASFCTMAFYGTLPMDVLQDIMFTNFAILFFTSLMSTPYIYLAKKICK